MPRREELLSIHLHRLLRDNESEVNDSGHPAGNGWGRMTFEDDEIPTIPLA